MYDNKRNTVKYTILHHMCWGSFLSSGVLIKNEQDIRSWKKITITLYG